MKPLPARAWPDKDERNLRLLECLEVTRALFRGETVTHRGRITAVEAKLYSRPKTPVPLFGAAVTPKTAKLAGSWTDGLLVAGHDRDAVAKLVEAFGEGGGSGKPVHVQMALSWASSVREAERHAVEQWAPATIGGEAAWDLRRPADFDQASRFVGTGDMQDALLVTDSMALVRDRIAMLEEIGVHTVHLHMVGTDQEGFIAAVAEGGLLNK